MYSWRSEVERQGESLLQRGMETGNQSQLGTGLQVAVYGIKTGLNK